MLVMKEVRLLLLIFLIGALLELTTCALLWGGAVRGKVVEQDTDRPIPGALIAVVWEGTAISGIESTNVCYHAELAITNEQGVFHTGAWLSRQKNYFVESGSRMIFVYKRGYYEPYLSPRKIGILSMIAKYIRWKLYPKLILARFTGTSDERLKDLNQLMNFGSCYYESGKSARNLYPFYAALYYEAKELGATEKDLRRLKEVAASAAVAEDTTHPQEETDKRVQKFLRDNLK